MVTGAITKLATNYADDVLRIAKKGLSSEAIKRAGKKVVAKAKPVVFESRRTIDVVEELGNVRLIEQLKKAEITGELTSAMKSRRLEIAQAFDDFEQFPLAYQQPKGIIHKIKALFTKKPTYTVGYRGIDYNVPGGHVPNWALTDGKRIISPENAVRNLTDRLG